MLEEKHKLDNNNPYAVGSRLMHLRSIMQHTSTVK